jgi:hypothetical protein
VGSLLQRPNKTKARCGGWVFHGSKMTPGGFGAELYGNFICLFYDADSLIGCASEDNRNDDAWQADVAQLPVMKKDDKKVEVEQAVTLIIKPAVQAAAAPGAAADGVKK